MRIWRCLFITIHLVCGKSESFKEVNESDIKRETSINNNDQMEVETNLLTSPGFSFIRGKKSLEERQKKQPKFHSWGGKRYEDEDEEEKEHSIEEEKSVSYDDIVHDGMNIGLNNQSLTENYITEDNLFSGIQHTGQLPAPISQEDKRDPEMIYDLKKRADFYDSLLQQVGFWPGLSEQNNKRYPAFNSWAGKRSAAFNSWGGKRSAAFNSWGGKRDSALNNLQEKKTAAFNSWGGKRAAAFNSWGGKRDAAFNSWGGKKDTAFNSWGGKRAAALNSWGGKQNSAFNSWGGKRNTAFNSWGGKRNTAFNSWGGKRAAAFNSWGGKRAAAFNSWGGKKNAAFNIWEGKRPQAFNSWGGKRTAAFNSWGGKRDLVDLTDWTGINNKFENEKENDEDSLHNNLGIRLNDQLSDEQNYDDTTESTSHDNTENKNEKRGAGFNSWDGSRVPVLNRWTGKRIVDLNSAGGKKSAAFNSWGGKRATGTSFNSWGGKREAAFNGWGGKRAPIFSNLVNNLDDGVPYTRKLETKVEIEQTDPNSNKENNEVSQLTENEPEVDFDVESHNGMKLKGSHYENSWKTVHNEDNFRGQQENIGLPIVSDYQITKRSNPAFSSWAGKRAPLFTPWYGNKIPSLQISSGKRRPAFSSWGGKRSELKPLQETDCFNTNTCPDMIKMYLAQSNEVPEHVNLLRKKREVNCISTNGISGFYGINNNCRDKKLDGNLNKGRIMTRMLFQGGLSRPMAIKSLTRGLDFYAWGGKRSL